MFVSFFFHFNKGHYKWSSFFFVHQDYQIYIKVFNVIIVDENLPTHFKNKTTIKLSVCCQLFRL